MKTPKYFIAGTADTMVAPNAKVLVILVVNIVSTALFVAKAKRCILLSLTCWITLLCAYASLNMKISSAPMPRIMNILITCKAPNKPILVCARIIHVAEYEINVSYALIIA